MSERSKMKSVMMIAPGHDLNDIRIKRSLNSLANCFGRITIILDEKYRRYNINEVPLGFSETEIIYDDIYKFIFNNKLKEHLGNNKQERFDLIYIHDSGLLGLLLLRGQLKRYNCKKIFDYHDWVQWEIYYQIKKRLGVNMFSKLVYRIIKTLIKHLIRNINIDYLIGISKQQIHSLRQDISGTLIDKDSLVIPNTRDQLLTHKAITEKEIALLWIGNFMKGRDIDQILTYISKLPPSLKISLYICGNIYDKIYFEKVVKINYVKYLGAFKNDEELSEMIPSKKMIGIFLGWDDKFDTNINMIASPNKIYSYINLNLPIIYNSELSNIRKITGDNGCVPINSYDMFKSALELFNINYDKYHQDMAKNKESIQWNNEIQEILNIYVEDNFTD